MEDSKDYLNRIVELPYIIESDSIEELSEGSYRTWHVRDLKPGMELSYVLDADPKSFTDPDFASVFGIAGTIFINAVMGYTTLFAEGSKATYKQIDQNKKAMKLFGGGDTIQEFKDLLPVVFSNASNDSKYYFFTGGGAILDAIEKGSPFFMKPIEALLE